MTQEVRKLRVRFMDGSWRIQQLDEGFNSWFTYFGIAFYDQARALEVAGRAVGGHPGRYELVAEEPEIEDNKQGEVWPNLEPQPAHCSHVGNNTEPDPSRKGLHDAHVWHDWAINQNNAYWCDGANKSNATAEPISDDPCPCGYGKECAVHCNHIMKDGCPPIKQIEIQSTEQMQLWVNVLNRRSIRDAKQIHQLAERVRELEKPWWKRVFQ